MTMLSVLGKKSSTSKHQHQNLYTIHVEVHPYLSSFDFLRDAFGVRQKVRSASIKIFIRVYLLKNAK